MSTETTLILVKPDAVADGLTGEVFRRFEKEGLRILNCRMIR
jgi:nucleoside-diphosphate kinase